MRVQLMPNEQRLPPKEVNENEKSNKLK